DAALPWRARLCAARAPTRPAPLGRHALERAVQRRAERVDVGGAVELGAGSEHLRGQVAAGPRDAGTARRAVAVARAVAPVRPLGLPRHRDGTGEVVGDPE